MLWCGWFLVAVRDTGLSARARPPPRSFGDSTRGGRMGDYELRALLRVSPLQRL
jgi:hypothetical protein